MKSRTYEEAGVPHLKADAAYNRRISNLIRSTHIPGVLGKSTGFAALFDFKKLGIRNPVIVSSTDGVGTKLELAMLQKRHDTVGIDLVAMCVNDLVTCGARPVFFLDYFATGKFNAAVTQEVLRGIAAGCREAGCALVGGETAIMPGFYRAGAKNGVPQYDLAGFSVGLVDRNRIIDGQKIRSGDVLLGVASAGFHSNGFSLLRKTLSKADLGGSVGKKLLTPTRIYVKPVLKVINEVSVSGIAHITGGGLEDNIQRIMPKGLTAEIDTRSWPIPKLLQIVQDSGKISSKEMRHTFNMGIGLVFILKKHSVAKTQKILSKLKMPAWVIGRVVRGRRVEFV